MSTRSQLAPLCLKKPNLLILPFVKGANSPLNSGSLTHSRESSPHAGYLTPQSSQQKPTHMKHKSSQYARTGSVPRAPRKGTDDLISGVHIHEEGDRKAAIKFGKAMQLTKITTQEKKEEMRERYLLARKYVQELKGVRIYEDGRGHVFNKKKVMDESERVIKLADNVFAAMNISVREYVETQLDSAMTIFPVEDRPELATFYQNLTPEICDFPSAFIAKLKIFMITICSEASLYSPNFNSILEQKKRNGLCLLKELDTPEAVREYWYKLVALHLVKADPMMFEEWKEFIKNENVVLGLRKYEVKSDLEELILTLQCVIRPQDTEKIGLLRAHQKTRFLKRALKNFEPLCFDEGWWDMKYKDDLYGK